jgi:hypothetical protein
LQESLAQPFAVAGVERFGKTRLAHPASPAT